MADVPTAKTPETTAAASTPRDDFPGHLGLQSMRERAEQVGASLEVDSAPGAGTRIRARLLAG